MPRRDDEVELPYSPVKRWERRVEAHDYRESEMREFFRELITIIKMNQEIVDEMVKANDVLRIEISKLPARLDEVSKNMNELITYVKAAAEEERVGYTGTATSTTRIDQLIELNKKLVETNENINIVLDSIDKRLKRPLPPPPFRPLVR